MTVTCRPTREIFNNIETGFRVIACQPTGFDTPTDLTLNKYNNFTLSGSNISNLELYNEYDLDIRPDQRSKYDASYIVIGYPGIDVNESITVSPDVELKYLKTIMSHGQATSVNSAYPNFIQMVLNNQEGEIDYKKIKGVGAIYLEKYIDKIKASYKSILFAGLANDWQITGDKRIDALVNTYATPQECADALNTNPYFVLVNVTGYGFVTADNKVLEKKPEMVDSVERCEYGCIEILRQNEAEGDTRLNANVMYHMIQDLVPESSSHVVEAVSNSRYIHYDDETKYAALVDTYEAEKTIAEAITYRLDKAHKVCYDMNYEEYKNVDGLNCTDEQGEILKLANDENVMLLTGSAGSGKTSSVKALIKMLDHYMKHYLLLAPTGVAAKRLSESTGRKAQTVHMFLARLQNESYSTDYVILDEFSMVGVDLLAKLIKSIGNSKLIFVCDNAQLSSISCGNILQDLIDSNLIPRANLTKVFRYGIGGISTVATDIRNGKQYLSETGEPLFHSEVNDYTFLPISSDPIEQIVDTYSDLLDQGYKTNDIMVLCPFNKSKVGTYAINKAIQTRFNAHDYTDISYERDKFKIEFKVGDKVINTKNNYHMPVVDYSDEGGMQETGCEMFVANGDIGYIRAYKKDEVLGNCLFVEFDNGLGLVNGECIEDLLLGYSISVHKSQGSQSKVVISITDKSHKNMLSRNLLYVSSSRAQEKLIEIGNVGVINDALQVQENKERDTFLKDMLVRMNGGNTNETV